MIDKVDEYIRALDKLPKDNGLNLVWCYSLAYTDKGEGIRVTMQNRWAKPPVTYQRFIPSNYVLAMDDPESAAAKMIENMYEEARECYNAEKLLMSPDEAASILREFTKGFEEYGAWGIEDDVLITALKVAIKCLEEKCHE